MTSEDEPKVAFRPFLRDFMFHPEEVVFLDQNLLETKEGKLFEGSGAFIASYKKKKKKSMS